MSQDHAFSILSTVPHSRVVVSDARNVLYSRVRSFAVLSFTSHGSLTLKLAYPSAASVSPILSPSLSLSLFLSSSRDTYELRLDVVSPSSDVRSDRTRLQSRHGPLSKFEKNPDRFSFSQSSYFLFQASRFAVASRKKARLTRQCRESEKKTRLRDLECRLPRCSVTRRRGLELPAAC